MKENIKFVQNEGEQEFLTYILGSIRPLAEQAPAYHQYTDHRRGKTKK